MRYLHTMLRVKDLDESVAFYKLLGLQEVRRRDSEAGRYTLVFLAPEGQEEAQIELTYNWDGDGAYPMTVVTLDIWPIRLKIFMTSARH